MKNPAAQAMAKLSVEAKRKRGELSSHGKMMAEKRWENERAKKKEKKRED